jgi:hypothetical protein
LLTSSAPPGVAAAVVIVAVYVAPYARVVPGVSVNVATMPLYVTDPATAPPGPVTVKVPAAVIEAGSIAWLKVALIVVPTATLEAP